MAAGGAFDGKDIKIGPGMGSVRENGREFGHCAEVKSVFMGASRPSFVGIWGRRIHYEMVGMFAQAKEESRARASVSVFLGYVLFRR